MRRTMVYAFLALCVAAAMLTTPTCAVTGCSSSLPPEPPITCTVAAPRDR